MGPPGRVVCQARNRGGPCISGRADPSGALTGRPCSPSSAPPTEVALPSLGVWPMTSRTNRTQLPFSDTIAAEVLVPGAVWRRPCLDWRRPAAPANGPGSRHRPAARTRLATARAGMPKPSRLSLPMPPAATSPHVPDRRPRACDSCPSAPAARLRRIASTSCPKSTVSHPIISTAAGRGAHHLDPSRGLPRLPAVLRSSAGPVARSVIAEPVR